MLKKLFTQLLFLSLFALYSNAQVTIGDGVSPASYSILQIEGVGGIRLPKFTQAEKDQLEATFTSSTEGVVIYFDGGAPDNSYFQFWDGTQWISMKYINNVVNAENRITDTKVATGDIVSVNYGLGGSLIEDTKLKQITAPSEIALLKFDPASGGRFTVMDNALVVTDDAVGIGTSVPEDVVLEVAGEEGEAFRYQATNPKEGYVLVSDAIGNASWADITPNIREKEAAIKNAVNIGSTSISSTVAVSEELFLEKGIWLIMARYVARTVNRFGLSSYAEAAWGENAWLILKNNKSGTSEEIVRVGQLPQLMDRYITTTPQLVYILNVKEDGTYVVHGAMKTNTRGVDSVTGTIPTSTAYGNSYFKAIQLSQEPSIEN